MLSLGTLLIIFLLNIILYYFTTIKTYIKSLFILHRLPGPPKVNFLFGNILEVYTTPENIFRVVRKWAKSHHPIYKLWMTVVAVVNITNPDDCELILSNSKHLNKSRLYEILHDWVGNGLLTAPVEQWEIRRKILNPAFNIAILQDLVKIFNEQTTRLLEVLQEETHKPYTKINNPITQFTLRVITETTMGIKLDEQKELEYRRCVANLSEILLYRLLRPWFFLKAIYQFTPTAYKERQLLKSLQKFTDDIIAKRRATLDMDKNNKSTLLDLMLMHNVIDNAGVREEVSTFIFGGHDTTAMTLCFSLMLIACHAHIQEQIVDEMREVLGDLNKKPTYSDLQELKLLERCIKETLRLYPSVQFISRQLGEDLTSNSGYIIPQNAMVNIHIYDIHHNSAIYPDPEKFDPDRFLPDVILSRHPYAYLPFSAGPRNCIGQKFALLELKTALCGILSRFIVEPVDTPENIVLIVDLTLRSKDDIKVRFRSRFP